MPEHDPLRSRTISYLHALHTRQCTRWGRLLKYLILPRHVSRIPKRHNVGYSGIGRLALYRKKGIYKKRGEVLFYTFKLAGIVWRAGAIRNFFLLPSHSPSYLFFPEMPLAKKTRKFFFLIKHFFVIHLPIGIIVMIVVKKASAYYARKNLALNPRKVRKNDSKSYVFPIG